MVRKLPGGASGKEPACQCRSCKRCGFDPCVEKSPWRRAWQPTLVLMPGESHGQRSPAGYNIVSQRVGHDWGNLAHMHMLRLCLSVLVLDCRCDNCVFGGWVIGWWQWPSTCSLADGSFKSCLNILSVKIWKYMHLRSDEIGWLDFAFVILSFF